MEEIIVIAVCLGLNALLAATEMAFVTVSKPRLRELARNGNEAAQKILSLRENPERTLSVLQIGITLVGVIAAAVGGAGAEETLHPIVRDGLGLSDTAAEFTAIFIVVLPIAYLSVVVGELVPKSLALKNSLRVVLKAARWLVLFDRLLAPIVDMLEWSTKKLLRIFTRRVKPETPPSAPDTVELDQLSQQARQYVVNLVGIEKKRVRDVLLPWDRVITVDARQPAEEVESVILSSGHTRLPVMKEEAVAGVLNAKEFMVFRKSGADPWETVIRPAVQAQESDSLLKALRQMQEKRSHLSVVLNGERRVGIVTIEDVLEEIIGEVFDEDDDGALKRILSTKASFRKIGPRPQEP